MTTPGSSVDSLLPVLNVSLNVSVRDDPRSVQASDPEKAVTPTSPKHATGSLFNDSEDEDLLPVLNTKEKLRRGIIETTDDKDEFTILLVGETGVGKTSTLNYFANVLRGRTPTHYAQVHSEENEQGGSQSRSQTNDALLYTFRSRNGVTVRILDTPGLADTRGLLQDEQHKVSIAKAIQENITTVDAVLILANGTVPRLGVSTNYALSTLSAIFPRSLAENIGIMFTMTPSILQCNFEPESLPAILRNSEVFTLSNPMCLKRKYDESNHVNTSKSDLKVLRQSFKDSEDKAMDMMVHLFDWLSSLTPQPTRDIISLYKKSISIEQHIANAISRIDSAQKKQQEAESLRAEISKANVDMNTFKHFQQIITQEVYKQVNTDYHSTLCARPECYSNCHNGCQLNFALDNSQLSYCTAMQPDRETCNVCGHTRQDHRHYNCLWRKVKDEHVSIDTVAKAKFTAAKTGKERKEKLMEEVQRVLDQCAHQVQDDLMRLGHLAEEYSTLSLSGGIAAQVRSSVKMIELKLADTQQGGQADPELLNKLEECLTVLKNKLAVLGQAREAQKQTSKGILTSLMNAITMNYN